MDDLQNHKWELEIPSRVIFPSHAYSNALSNFLASQSPPDEGFRFEFSKENAKQAISIHASRLMFATGPFAALATRNFRERSEHVVQLSEEDNPDSFAFLRDYLYCKEISFQNVPVSRIIDVMKAAHRWNLIPLFEVLCELILKAELLNEPSDIVTAAQLIAAFDVPDWFAEYFWRGAALHYDKFFPQLDSMPTDSGSGGDEGENVLDLRSNLDRIEADQNGAHASEAGRDNDSMDDNPDGHGDESERTTGPQTGNDVISISSRESASAEVPSNARRSLITELPARLSPLFPNLWELAVAKGAVRQLVRGIQHLSGKNWNREFLPLILIYVEPQMDDDDELYALIELLGPSSIRQEWLLSSEEVKQCSGRAVQLLSKSLLAPNKACNEMQSCWQLSLRQLGPCRRVFLFGPGTASNQNYGYSDSAWEVGPFNPSQAVQISVETRLRDANLIGVGIKWKVGPCVRIHAKQLKISFRLLANDCACGRRGDFKKPGVTEVLGRWDFAACLYERYVVRTVEFRDDPSLSPEESRRCTECTALGVLKVHAE